MSVISNSIAIGHLLNGLVPSVLLHIQLQRTQAKVHSFVSLCKYLVTDSQHNVQLTQTCTTISFLFLLVTLSVYISITF